MKYSNDEIKSFFTNDKALNFSLFLENLYLIILIIVKITVFF